MKRLAPCCISLLAATVASFASSAVAGPKTKPAKSHAITQEVIDALAQELERSKSMRLPGAPAPYFISYKVTEVEVTDVTASLGSVTAATRRHFVGLEAHVHIGTYQSDNTNFIVPRRESVDGIGNATFPVEATPAIARNLAWLATDQAYKEAVEQYSAKQDALDSGARGKDVPSYSKALPVVFENTSKVASLETEDSLRKRAETVSGFFRDNPAVRDSRASFTSFRERRWYLNTEGTSSHGTRRVSGILITASGQGTDGQELNMYISRYGRSAADLPTNAKLKTSVAELITTLGKLEKAPTIDSYTGPVLFEGEGAIGMIRHTLAPHLSGTPLPVGLAAQDTAAFGGEFLDRVGRRITAKNLSLHDDPTASKAGNKSLIGDYKFDDEGTPAKRIDVIKSGILVELPMSRTPSKIAANTNGHARRSIGGGLFRGSPTNLFATAKGGKSAKALKRQLIRLIKDEGLPYGLIIRQFDDPAASANPDLSRIELFQLLRSADPHAPPMATIAARVFPDGREELVRGVQLKRTHATAWRRVVGVGNKSTVKNFLATTDSPILVRLQGGLQGFVPSAGVESSISSPALLFSELAVEANLGFRRAKPAVPKPIK